MLTNISKICEKLIYNQFFDFFDDILSPSQCGFHYGYSTQHCLLILLEIFKESMAMKNKGNEFGALLTNQSKTFDCFDHELLITKLFWYVVSSLPPNLTCS